MRRIIILAALALGACQDHTGIQREYISHRDDCQDYAEGNISRYTSVFNTSERNMVRDRNAKLVSLFSDCMYEEGWTVATPKQESAPQTAAANNDSGVGIGVNIKPSRPVQ